MWVSESRREREDTCSKAEAEVQLVPDSEQSAAEGMVNLAVEEERVRRKPKRLHIHPKLLELISKFNKVAGCKFDMGHKVKNQLHILH